ncbi:unnamed protein product [Phytophthora lilii]|uniref:Unnamed protein product n=1 Tax=Phytophthora lilii TaxID=2077276 RepID=A0A9W6YK85_9STRA|nr:unnamed protein product [Phytophthora lilii]
MVMTTIARRVARCAVRGGQRAMALRAAQAAPALGVQQRALFSAKSGDGSHSDFQPQYHAAKSTEKDEILKMIESHVKTYPVMLYMKGTPSAPQCGFSMQVVRILHAQGVSFDSVNVLDHPEIREGVKEYSYVAGCTGLSGGREDTDVLCLWWGSGVQAMADDPAALREGRVRGRLRHHHGHEQVRRAGRAAGGIQEELDTRRAAWGIKLGNESRLRKVKV